MAFELYRDGSWIPYTLEDPIGPRGVPPVNEYRTYRWESFTQSGSTHRILVPENFVHVTFWGELDSGSVSAGQLDLSVYNHSSSGVAHSLATDARVYSPASLTNSDVGYSTIAGKYCGMVVTSLAGSSPDLTLYIRFKLKN